MTTSIYCLVTALRGWQHEENFLIEARSEREAVDILRVAVERRGWELIGEPLVCLVVTGEFTERGGGLENHPTSGLPSPIRWAAKRWLDSDP